MPKRSLEVESPVKMSAERGQKKTERSHEENQERAYIAASRRADRSIEARVQSARMASEIHKKRTGRGFKISEEIVMKEEMYEEEDDDLPRQYRALAAHLQTSSTEMNHRLSAYLTNQVAMASLARQQEVNRMFAEQFPNASRVSQQLVQSMYYEPLHQQTGPGGQTSSASPPFPPVNFGGSPQQPFQRDFSQSIAAADVSSQAHPVAAHGPPEVLGLPAAAAEDTLSPPDLTPGSGSGSGSGATDTPQTQATPPTFPQVLSYPAVGIEVDPSLSPYQPGPISSSFTAELSAEAKLLADINMADPLAPAFFGEQPIALEGGYQLPPYGEAAEPAKGQQLSMPEDYFSARPHHAGRVLELSGQRSTIGTPGGGEGDSWDSWVNTDQWSTQLGPEDPHH